MLIVLNVEIDTWLVMFKSCDVAFNSTSSKSVKQAIDMMARSARLEWSKL